MRISFEVCSFPLLVACRARARAIAISTFREEEDVKEEPFFASGQTSLAS